VSPQQQQQQQQQPTVCHRLALAAGLAVSALSLPSLAQDGVTTEQPVSSSDSTTMTGGAMEATGRAARTYNVDEELGLLLDAPYAGAARGPAARTPLMQVLDRAGAGSVLDDAGIRAYGYVEGSWTYNADDPVDDLNFGRVFDIENQDLTLNQISLSIERPVRPSGDQWDVGFNVQMIYGADARFLHSHGLMDNYEPEPGENGLTDGPNNQFDPVQFYVDLNVPVGDGLRVRAGRFLFFKQIDPNASVFYSHSFTFGAALPFTLTGATGTYQIGDNLSLEAGVVRGWGQSLEDNNDTISAVGRVRYDFSDRTTLSVAGITGPEQDDDNDNYRTAVDVVLAHRATDRLTFLLDAVYGYQAGVPGEGTADWYGLAAYGIYRVNDMVSAAVRLEYYRDDEGFTSGISGAGPAIGFSSQSLYEITAGLTITPFPTDPILSNLKVRPEVRYDYSSEPFFSGFTDHDQFTAAIEAFFNY
jgi:hypothetical protein